MIKSLSGVIAGLVFFVTVTTLAASAARTGASLGNPICAHVGTKIEVSAGGRMFCFGPQFTSGIAAPFGTLAPRNVTAQGNVDAANFSEDVIPSGARGYGQAETSIAAVDGYVVEAWNDSTGFFALCPTVQNKEELTGFSFSNNGGASFTDMGGVPNADCAHHVSSGDPSVAAFKNSSGRFFYIGSLYPGQGFDGTAAINYLALTPCRVSATSQLQCGQPVHLAQSSECVTLSVVFCNFLDKDFMTVDAARGRIYISYAEFSVFGGDRIEVAVCDIGTPAGGPGPAGGTAFHPVCPQGNRVSGYPATAPPAPFLVVSPASPCEAEGAYPDVDARTHNLYVGWEFNWFTNFAGCNTTPTKEMLAKVNANCLTLTAVSPCGGPQILTGVGIVSMDTAFIPGYNRFPMNDFPRIAVSEPCGTVSLVWNDTRSNPNGDILMQTFSSASLVMAHPKPVKINTTPFADFAFLPALRNADDRGMLNISWYDRREGTTTSAAATDVFMARGVSPLQTATPKNQRVTNVTSGWLNASSDIVPNFGDYTDNYVTFAPSSATFSGHRVYVAWADGRFNDPQPFEANFP